MLPVPAPHVLAAQPSAGSGAWKRARRCELPQTFFMLAEGVAGIGKFIVGLMTVVSLHTFELNDDTKLQLQNLLASRHPVDMHKYCVWQLSTVNIFLEGPPVVEQRRAQSLRCLGCRNVHGCRFAEDQGLACVRGWRNSHCSLVVRSAATPSLVFVFSPRCRSNLVWLNYSSGYSQELRRAYWRPPC